MGDFWRRIEKLAEEKLGIRLVPCVGKNNKEGIALERKSLATFI